MRGIASLFVAALLLSFAGCIEPNSEDRAPPQLLTKRLLVGRWATGDYVLEFERRNRGTLSKLDRETGETLRWPFKYEFDEDDQTAYIDGAAEEDDGKAEGKRGYLFVKWETENRRAGELKLDSIFRRVRPNG